MKKLVIALAGLVAVGGVANADEAGKKIYDTKCMFCHATGAAGAPKFGDKAAWEPRIATGMDALMTSVKNGKNAMPPMGTCMDCSDEDLKAAVEYMTSAAE